MTQDRLLHVIEDTRFRDHRAPVGHPERPERLAAVSEAVTAFGDRIIHLDPQPVDPRALLRVHDRNLVDLIEQSSAQGRVRLDADTYLSPDSVDVAHLAAGSVCDLARRVARGEILSGLAAVRPPGHHAEADRAMGFCLFNNIAVAARTLQAEEGLDKILIVDWDVHHGNGTQHAFYDDPSVLFVSTHQFPHYPGTGDFPEMGNGRGSGTTLNIPMPPGCGDTDFIALLGRILVPAARRFQPEMILVSCGFDAHRDDPLADMQLTEGGYRQMTQIVRALAEELCGGRVAFVLEGGYALSGLAEGTRAVLEAMLSPTVKIPTIPQPEPGLAFTAVLERVRAVHAKHFPELGAA